MSQRTKTEKFENLDFCNILFLNNMFVLHRDHEPFDTFHAISWSDTLKRAFILIKDKNFCDE